MKNRKSIFAFFAITAAMIFASCSNLTDANVSSSSEDKNTLNIEVTNYDEVVTQASKSANRASRTIIPDSFDSDGVDLYIYGVATTGDKFTAPVKVEFEGNTDAAGVNTSKTVGKIKIDAEAEVWEFTLAAVAKGDVPATPDEMKTKAVLIGYASLDMTYGDTAKFTLSPDGLTKEAQIAMKLYNDGWTTPDGYKITAGIYKLTDGADATTKGDGSGDATAKDFASLDTSEPATANYTLPSMTPGTYLFKVIYTSDATKKSFVWSDTLIVLPGKTVDSSIAIPNVIGEKPSVPTVFKASYEAGSEDERIGYYTVDFEWSRGSNNELSYELEVLPLAAATTLPSSDDEWNTAATGTKALPFDAKFSSSDFYSSGSLLTGNTAAAAYLELGVRYAARLRAVNDAGKSVWAYVTVDGTKGTAFTSAVISRYRITYNLNGGVYYSDGDTSKTGSAVNIVEYFCEKTTGGNAILQPDGKGADGLLNATADANSAAWGEWVTGDGTKFTETAYTGSANLELFAKYSSGTQDVEFLKKEDYFIKGTWLTVDEKAFTDRQNALSIDASKKTSSKWNFKPVADGNKITAEFKYDSVTIALTKGAQTYWSKTVYDVGTAGTDFVIPLSKLNIGTYLVTVSASYSTNIYVSYPIAANITR
ncbi:hypothetical protein SAMN02745152_00484 [Treponema berlinense]|uniref:Uncharacterized protein n=1 Tax=Treponema berlinense TaxID=225004 RepID=A0A1T4LD98_9SPIR|nr:hypothetical protein [Treponema berlinense]SJZ52719.1 hypothetical protein SAMN02745152_00484 [Treponema berlinense]